MKVKIYGLFMLLLLAVACKNHDGETKIIIYTRAPLQSKMAITKVPFAGESTLSPDTATIKDNHDSLVFYISRKEEGVFKIVVATEPALQITLINDSKIVRIQADYFADTCSITGSAASTSLKNFYDTQAKLSKQLTREKKYRDSVKLAGKQGEILDSLSKRLNGTVIMLNYNSKVYADTVKSPAAFMAVLNGVRFGDDKKGLRRFILKAAKRFPRYKPVQDVVKQTLALLKVYEQDLNVGDQIPSITLPDSNGNKYATQKLKGQYYLVDFWSSHCVTCYPFKTAEYNLNKNYPVVKVRFLSLAIDANTDTWKQAIRQLNYPAINLIDHETWLGPTVSTFLIDSIPYNFLVNPQGKIIAKAIKPDSLLKVIKRLVK